MTEAGGRPGHGGQKRGSRCAQLVVAAQGAGDRGSWLAVGTGQEHLAAADSEAGRGAHSSFEGYALVGGERANE